MHIWTAAKQSTGTYFYKFSSKKAESLFIASSSFSPSVFKVISCPHLTARPITAKIRFASASFPSFSMITLHGNAAASFTNNPAGLAWIPCSSLIVFLSS